MRLIDPVCWGFKAFFEGRAEEEEENGTNSFEEEKSEGAG
jgi:hypothetical protein